MRVELLLYLLDDVAFLRRFPSYGILTDRIARFEPLTGHADPIKQKHMKNKMRQVANFDRR